MDNMGIYNKVRAVPEEAKKTIQGGRLKGMTDINPMWRIKTLTELFGPCGIGWWTENEQYTLEDGPNGERAVCCELDLFFIDAEGRPSKPVHGVGGTLIIAKEKTGLRLDDEAWKKARTDAVSVACKSLGIGADVYWQADRTKYSTSAAPAETFMCERCNRPVTGIIGKDGNPISVEYVVAFSRNRFNKGTYCAECQKVLERARREREEAMKGSA